jgi:hypothetical protein
LGNRWHQQGKDKAITPYKNAENLIRISEKRCEIAINSGLCYQK